MGEVVVVLGIVVVREVIMLGGVDVMRGAAVL